MARVVVPNPPRESLEEHVKKPGLVDISSNLHQSEVHKWVESLGDTGSQELFDNLRALYKQQKEMQITDLYVIQKFKGLKKYDRASSVLTKGHHNMFYVPVWASAYRKLKKPLGSGYVMYPQLTSVKDMLVKVVRDQPNDLNQALRMCFTSILALDNLHTEVSHCCARPQYIHRAVCLDNMYVLAVKDINDNKVYGEAMLKLGEITKELDDGYQGNSYRDDENLFKQYFHHPEACNEPMMYTCGLDYFSYGVYILEVLTIALNDTFDRETPTTGEDKVAHYTKIADRLKEQIIKNKSHKLSKYLEIATYFLDVNNYKSDKEMSYVSDASPASSPSPAPSPSPASSQPTTYHHEYPLNNHTSRLLAAIEENKGAFYTPIQKVLEGDEPAVCQSCLISLSVPLPTRCYQRDSRYQSDACYKGDSEQRCTPLCIGFYCLHCYREGERLFCRSHGTTSPMLGHPWSYALIMYGEEWTGEDRQLFATNAKFLANLMKSGLINGVPKQNVLVRSLISKDPKVELKAHCKEIQDLIHGEVTIRCGGTGEDIKSRTQHQTESTEYSFTLAYIGHGTKECKEDRGAWKPAEDGNCIEKSDVDLILGTIRVCGTDKCNTSLISFTYIKDHCFPSRDKKCLFVTCEDYVKGRSRTPQIVKVSAVDGMETNLGEITDFIGRLLTSSFDDYTSTLYEHRNRVVAVEDNRMAHAENGGGVQPMEAGEPNIPVKDSVRPETDVLQQIIKSGIKCGYLTAMDLSKLSIQTYDFKNRVVCKDPRPTEDSYPAILAYYNHGGLKNRVFAWNPDDKDYDVGFAIERDCTTIRNKLKDVLGEDVGLLSSLRTSHSTYSLPRDDNISGMFGAATRYDRHHHKLYYLVIKDPVKVELIRNCERTGKDFNIDLDKSQISKSMVRQEGKHSIHPDESDLPSLLVYITRYLYDQKDRSVPPSITIPAEDSSGEEPGQTSSASDRHQISTSNPQDAVRNSFLRQIYAHKNPAVTVESLHLNDCKSSQFSHKEDVDEKLTVEVEVLQSTLRLLISWTDTDEPSTEEEGNSGEPPPDGSRPDDSRPEMETEDPL